MASIEIYPYDSTWPTLFLETAKPIREALGPVAKRIDHVGSTSIPGAAAKPIIDIQISVASFEPFAPILQPLNALGYNWRESNPHRSKRCFRETPGTRRTHIHVRRAGTWSEQLPLLFRDYLRLHPHDLQDYIEVKYQLAAQFPEDRSAYTGGKSAIIWQIIRKATEWAQIHDWYAGPSDV